ncbi:GxxExxY protein [Mangrovivirga sp. M17]|uniref:GxxExxY protein n=1 Tax=Mangrovivirga halotolerans TaxID=2993936 RepID=A0ABT3RV00_9BACT|nr:GxxExxY protein [Mangrovivirga halotolerans]MCX2745179.1 GxxExxY protein [Mangrovivirga halotolerans]
MNENQLSKVVLQAAIEVHKQLGAGLLESVYEKCLIYELEKIGLEVKSQILVPISYKNEKLDSGFRLDLLIENKLILEIKSVKELEPIHTAQLLTYLKLTNLKLGLLLNFNVPLMKNGIKRIVNHL